MVRTKLHEDIPNLNAAQSHEFECAQSSRPDKSWGPWAAWVAAAAWAWVLRGVAAGEIDVPRSAGRPLAHIKLGHDDATLRFLPYDAARLSLAGSMSQAISDAVGDVGEKI